MATRRLIIVLTILGAVVGTLTAIVVAGEWMTGFSFSTYLLSSDPLKLAATIVVLAVSMFCAFVLLRMFLEDLGILKSDEQWHDWRDDLGTRPGSPESEGPALLDSSNSTDEGPWPLRTKLRSRRKPVPKINWRFLKQ